MKFGPRPILSKRYRNLQLQTLHCIFEKIKIFFFKIVAFGFLSCVRKSLRLFAKYVLAQNRFYLALVG